MKPTIPAVTAIAILTLVGCASEAPDRGITLTEADFRPSRRTRGVGVWRNEEAPLRGYSRFTVDPVRIVTVQGVTMDPAVERQIAEQLRRELVVRLADEYEVIGPPGAGVLRLTVSVLGVRPGGAMGLGEARLHVLVADSITGKPLLAVRVHRPPVGTRDRSPLSDWEKAREAMIDWADALDREVEAAGR